MHRSAAALRPANMLTIDQAVAINQAVAIDWQPASHFGWGVYGLNLMLNWAIQQREPMLTQAPLNDSLIALGPIEWTVLRPALERSRELQSRLAALRGQQVAINIPVLHALGNDFIAPAAQLDSALLTGSPNIGVTFFESTGFSVQGRERAKSYALIIAGSSWNKALLDAAGVGPTALTLQGVDPTAFHPAPKAGWFAGRFAVFSGGKLEYRKGQDLVLKAFQIFAQRHPDALLVTAWNSPWPDAARNFGADPSLAPVRFAPDGRLDAGAWAADNGVSPDQFLDLGTIANSALPRLYREMDVGLFPNRCEGGTNLVAMECMACGVPVILAANTGHLDLVAPDRCYPLGKQTPLAGADRAGWGESDIEEIVETLEAVRSSESGRRERAARGAQFMRSLTWAETARRLAEVIAPYQ